jgi:hypothetical protein
MQGMRNLFAEHGMQESISASMAHVRTPHSLPAMISYSMHAHSTSRRPFINLNMIKSGNSSSPFIHPCRSATLHG